MVTTTSIVTRPAGSLEKVERIVGQIREHWPQVQVILRGDLGFCRNALMTW